MKTTAIVFTNTIPEVKAEESGFLIDFGVVMLELTSLEMESLLMNIAGAYGSANRRFETFDFRRVFEDMLKSTLERR